LPAALVGCCSVACLLKYCLGPSLAGYEPINRVRESGSKVQYGQYGLNCGAVVDGIGLSQ